ncbi:hypothetical protein POM88_025364 [Heracleum sosnowskyi]|uniref:Uncharacterized protein n=1 Tax=Heracleum sosnowskyi TaxID=360622 RepID=A0AAD8I4Z6_9APIA|nr:hypothetical protein POM88_025364 [Heracleum sosnowskyi]
MKVAIWDVIIPNLSPLLEGEFDTLPVLVLASVKANCHFGAIRITSLPSTKIYVNLQDASTAIMRQSNYENPDAPEFSTDIIGVVEDFENVKLIKTMFGERNIVKFRITDGRYSHKVSVWGKLAVTTDELHSKMKETPIIAIVTSCKMKIFRSSVQISTLPSSKILLNLDDECVAAMRIRLEEEGYKVPENVEPTQLPIFEPQVIQTITLKELSEKTNTEELKVLKIELYIENKRFKIVVLAEDSTEAFNFILKDRAAKRAIGFTATKLIANKKKDGENTAYPAEISAIVGKELTFTIQINDDNILLNSKIFTVIDAYDMIALTASTCLSASTSEATMPGFTATSISEIIV